MSYSFLINLKSIGVVYRNATLEKDILSTVFSELRSASLFYGAYFQQPFCHFWVAEYSSFNKKEIIGAIGVHHFSDEKKKILETTNYLNGLELKVSLGVKKFSCIFLCVAEIHLNFTYSPWLPFFNQQLLLLLECG